MSTEDLEIEAMMLPPDERERLAERLLWSLGCDLAYERERSAWPIAPEANTAPSDRFPVRRRNE